MALIDWRTISQQSTKGLTEAINLLRPIVETQRRLTDVGQKQKQDIPQILRALSAPIQPVDRSNLSKPMQVLGKLGEMGTFGPAPTAAVKLSQAFPTVKVGKQTYETPLAISHYASGASAFPFFNIEKEVLGEQLPEREKYQAFRGAGGLTTATAMGGAGRIPLTLLMGSGFGVALPTITQAGMNVLSRKPIFEGISKKDFTVEQLKQKALTGAMFAAETLPSMLLTQSFVDMAAKTLPFLRPLTSESIKAGAPIASMTIAEWFKALGQTTAKRLMRANLIETPFETFHYGIRNQREGETLKNSIQREFYENAIFNNFYGLGESLADAKSVFGVVNRSIQDAMIKTKLGDETGAIVPREFLNIFSKPEYTDFAEMARKSGDFNEFLTKLSSYENQGRVNNFNHELAQTNKGLLNFYENAISEAGAVRSAEFFPGKKPEISELKLRRVPIEESLKNEKQAADLLAQGVSNKEIMRTKAMKGLMGAQQRAKGLGLLPDLDYAILAEDWLRVKDLAGQILQD